MSFPRKIMIAAAALGLSSIASASSVGFVPKRFSDQDSVLVRYQHKASATTKARAKLTIRDGIAQGADVIEERFKWVTFRRGVLTDVDFGPFDRLGKRATGVKLLATAEIVGPNAVGSAVAKRTVTKQCVRKGTGRDRYAYRVCTWSGFQGY